MQARVHAHDWAATPLGVMSEWSSSLKAVAQLVLASGYPMCCAVGPELTFIYNDAYAPFLGGRHPEALGHGLRDVWGELWSDIQPFVSSALQGESSMVEDAHLVMLRNGYPEDTWFSFSFNPLRDESGTIFGTFAICNDSTAKVLAVRKLSDERDGLWEASLDVSVVIDAQGQVLAINPAATRVLGWQPSEMIGKSIFDFVLPEDAEATTQALTHATSAALPTFVNRYRHKDGSFSWLSWVAAPRGERIYATARDITSERAAAAELANAQEALRQSQKMEALGQLTGGVAHDFNNMLAGILGSIELARRKVATGSIHELDALLERAESSGKRAATLTQRLLAFARRQPLRVEAVNVGVMLRSLSEMFACTLGAQIQLRTFVAEDLWLALIDAAQFESALLNLVLNARDAMGGVGHLTIEARNDATSDKIDVDAGEYVVVSVSDDGSGMPPEVLSKAFDPFFTTKPIGQGTGLGLSMIYGLMKQSSGHVRLGSQVGAGTTVTLFIPRAHRADQAADANPAPVDATKGETILLVEDDMDVRFVHGALISEFGYDFVEAIDGPSAISILNSNQPIDLMITDVGLPGMNGRQLAEIARAIRPALPVLFVTGYAEHGGLNANELSQGMQMITKPVPIDGFLARIKQMINGDALPTSQMAATTSNGRDNACDTRIRS